jgi:hypothetical protein
MWKWYKSGAYGFERGDAISHVPGVALSRTLIEENCKSFIHEVHSAASHLRAQQDSFLPVMEDGTITLVGATIEHPSFELNTSLVVARESDADPAALRGGGAREASRRALRGAHPAA